RPPRGLHLRLEAEPGPGDPRNRLPAGPHAALPGPPALPGDPYRLFGLFGSNVHLVGSRGPLYLFGTDRMGRDLFSRIIYGARVSLSVGLIGVILTLLIGSALGTASGYWGGTADMAVQRLIELLSAFPSIPLWMALAAALPPTWSSIQVYFAITVIL